MSNGSGSQGVWAAGILGACVLGSAALLSHSIAEIDDGLGLLTLAVQEMGAGPGRPTARAPQPARSRGPEAGRVYAVDTRGAPAKGPSDAPVTLVEFSDFQCPFCARVTPTLARVEREYGERVRIVFKHLPLSIHPKARAAHAAAAAAQLQGRFWEMHDKIFANQREMSEQKYVEWAGALGLDVKRFQRDLESRAVRARVEADLREASKLGVSGTPAFFINGRYLSGAKPFAEFKTLIDRELGG